MATLGYVRSSNGPDLAQIGANQQLVSHVWPNSPSGVFLAYSVSGYVGRWGGAAVMRYGGWSASSSSAAPGTLLFRTEEISPTVNYMDGGGGQKLTGRIVDGSNNLTIVAIPSSQIVALGAASRNAAAGIAMYQASAINQPNESFYRKGISGTTLQTASGSSASNEGQLALQLNGDYNVRPNRPGAITISGGASNQRPTVRAPFSDPNEKVNGVDYDRLETYRMEVWWGGTRRSNDVYTATATERTGRYSQRQIAPTIPFDTPYSVFVFHRDRAGAESESRSYSGTIHSGAAVDTPTSPTGRTTTPTNPGGITAVYRSSGNISANAVRVRLVNTAGTPIATSAILSRTVSPNASTTVTWTQSGFGTQPDGTTRGVQMQARDTNGNWSSWSGTAWFSTNAAPNIPTVFNPPNGYVASTLQWLQFNVSDPDQPWSDLTGEVELRTSSGSLIDTVPMVPNPGGAHRLIADHDRVVAAITSYQQFTWRGRVFDGHLWSGWSSPTTYIYAAVPSVTITVPTGPTISTSQPTLTWASDSYTHWRVRGYDGSRPVYDTGEILGPNSSSGNHMVTPEVNWIGGERWNNGEEFQWEVLVRSSSGLWGSSGLLSLTLEYPPVDDLIIDGAAMALPSMSSGTHYNQITTSVTTYPEGQFRGYHRRRVAVDGLNGAEIPGTEITLPTETSAGATVLNDFHVISNQWYRYTMWQEIEVGNDVISSAEVSIDLVASWHGVVLFNNADPLASSVWLKFGGPGGNYEPQMHERMVRTSIGVRGRRAPIAAVTGQRVADPSGEYTFITTESQTAMEQLERLYQVNDWQYRHLSPNGRPNGICYRSGRGGSRGLMYVTLNDISERPFTPTAHVVDLSFEEYEFHPYAEVTS